MWIASKNINDHFFLHTQTDLFNTLFFFIELLVDFFIGPNDYLIFAKDHLHVGDRELVQKISLWQHRKSRQPILHSSPIHPRSFFTDSSWTGNWRGCVVIAQFIRRIFLQMAAEFSIGGSRSRIGWPFSRKLLSIKNEL